MTCSTAIYIVATAGAVYTALSIYALYRQQKWMADQQQHLNQAAHSKE